MPDTVLTDPLSRTITLHDHTWFGHILIHHPEMHAHRDLVELAVANPLEIRISDSDANCRLYFGTGPREGIMIMVVADVVAAFVKTAHQIKVMKGAVEWSKPTPSKGS